MLFLYLILDYCFIVKTVLLNSYIFFSCKNNGSDNERINGIVGAFAEVIQVLTLDIFYLTMIQFILQIGLLRDLSDHFAVI